MRLAQTINLELGGRRFMLRPTLRAAVVLERAHGLDALASEIVDLNVTAISDTIAATAFGSIDWADEITSLMIPGGLVTSAMAIVPDLLELLAGLAGIDPDAEPDEEKPDAEPTPIAESQRTLFQIATGKLGWPPAVAWDATPLEILEAWKGRIELLADIFGDADDKPKKGKGEGPSLDDKIGALIAYNATRPGASVL